jgi:hypothetical protein
MPLGCAPIHDAKIHEDISSRALLYFDCVLKKHQLDIVLQIVSLLQVATAPLQRSHDTDG